MKKIVAMGMACLAAAYANSGQNFIDAMKEKYIQVSPYTPPAPSLWNSVKRFGSGFIGGKGENLKCDIDGQILKARNLFGPQKDFFIEKCKEFGGRVIEDDSPMKAAGRYAGGEITTWVKKKMEDQPEQSTDKNQTELKN